MLTKPLRMFATSTVAQELQKTLPKLMASLLEAFRDDTMDMYVVENKEGSSQIRAAGYRNFTGKLDETTIFKKCDYQVSKTLWFKVDDYGESYIGTILFPEEYQESKMERYLLVIASRIAIIIGEELLDKVYRDNEKKTKNEEEE